MGHMHGMGMAMGSMSMGTEVPDMFYLQKMYWAAVGAAVAFALGLNILEKALHIQRIMAANRKDRKFSTPAKPKSAFFLTLATVTAMFREVAYAPIPPLRFRRLALHFQPTGRFILVLSNFFILIALSFYKLNARDQWQWENIAYRTGFITICQIPLLFLLAGKNNIIGLLSGSSYERLNMLHRWAARCLLLTATLHMGYWFTDWARWDYISAKIKEDSITQKGLIAWSLLLWIVFSSASPIRGRNYEFFVLQHILSFVGFIAVVYLHTPAENHVWIWISVGLLCFDRLLRAAFVLYNNLFIFDRQQHAGVRLGGLWACKAEFEPLPHNTTRISVFNPPTSWRAGQHVFLSCHSILPLQSHPFTISSLPRDGKMVFVVRAERGGTKRFFWHAEKQLALPSSGADLGVSKHANVVIDGPYGRVRPLRQFDSVVFFAGSAGATFTVPLMRDLISAWDSPKEASVSRINSIFGVAYGAVTRHIRFVWVIKSSGQLDWFSQQLFTVMEDVRTLRESRRDISVEMSIYITCDDEFTLRQNSINPSSPSPSSAESNTHGVLEEVESRSTRDEKTSIKDDLETLSLHSLPTSTSSAQDNQPRPTACGPNGTCCCTRTIVDEDSIVPTALRICKCSTPGSRPSTTKRFEITEKPQPMTKSVFEASSTRSSLHPEITLLSGRPQPENIIRRTLEQAYGESAVVVCGPHGLVDDVRRSVVSLSDERAIHKGTGAQGVYLHTEAFDY